MGLVMDVTTLGAVTIPNAKSSTDKVYFAKQNETTADDAEQYDYTNRCP